LGEGAKGRRPLPPPPAPLPQSLKCLYVAGGGGAFGSASSHPRKRVGRGAWGEGRDLRSLALPSKYIFLLSLLLTLVLVMGGCGKKVTPLSPEETAPGPVREFRLAQEGDSLVLSWLLPRENLLGQPLTQVQGCRLYRAEIKGVQPVSGCLPEFVLWADIDLAYPRAGQVRGEAMVYQDRDLAPDRRYYYRVGAYDQEGYPGTWSKDLSHAWGVLPQAPRELRVEAEDRLVQLSWRSVTKLADGSPLRDLAGYFVYRRSGEGDWLRITPNPIAGTAYQDVAVLNDVEYNYKLRSVRRLGPDLLVSLDSASLTALPEKLTPPPPLLNLVGAPTSKGIELHWDASPAPDLAGYRVYRRRSGESQFTRLTRELLSKPYFLDSQVAHGNTYYYYVTAVDNSRRANESLPSEEAEVTY
jgi:hypothetical protein